LTSGIDRYNLCDNFRASLKFPDYGSGPSGQYAGCLSGYRQIAAITTDCIYISALYRIKNLSTFASLLKYA